MSTSQTLCTTGIVAIFVSVSAWVGAEDVTSKRGEPQSQTSEDSASSLAGAGGRGGLAAHGAISQAGDAGVAKSAPSAENVSPSTTEKPATGDEVVDRILDARCKVAICFGEKRSVGIEPLVELPVGKSFSVSNGAVGDYINNHDLRIDLAAGIRVWAFRDWVSLSMYLSKPLSDRSIRIPGSEFNYPSSALRRPLPGFALGLLFDSIWLGLDRDELRNPDGTAGISHDPTYPPNALVGSSWTLTLALQPVTAFRTGLGVAVSEAQKKSQSGGAKP